MKLEEQSARLAERIATCLPAATFEMETLCSLGRIEASRQVPTAAVECKDRPRLLLNPDFVAEHCRRDEHLFLLVMHELHHILLAHTRLYLHVTRAQNVAFDAIINAALCRQFPGPEYRGFFEALNAADTLPALLLRPPVGWPARPQYPDDGLKGVAPLLERLYPPQNRSDVPMPLYQELLDELAALPALKLDWSAVVLLGDHDLEREERALADPLLGSILRRIVAKWPPPLYPTRGRDLGREPSPWMKPGTEVGAETRRAFQQVLRRLLGPVPGAHTARTRGELSAMGGLGVLPTARDRLAPARRALGAPTTLWQQPVVLRARVGPPRRTHVYLDVSGSMSALLPHLVGLLLPYAAAGEAEMFQFSTTVQRLPLAQLKRGELTSTGGTDIQPVLAHALEQRGLRQMLVLTDGYTGEPGPAQRRALDNRKLRLHVVLPHESAWKQDLEAAAASMTVLPPLERAPAWSVI